MIGGDGLNSRTPADHLPVDTFETPTSSLYPLQFDLFTELYVRIGFKGQLQKQCHEQSCVPRNYPVHRICCTVRLVRVPQDLVMQNYPPKTSTGISSRCQVLQYYSRLLLVLHVTDFINMVLINGDTCMH